MSGSQGAVEYRYKFFVDALNWLEAFAREQWTFIVIGIVVLATVWWSVRR